MPASPKAQVEARLRGFEPPEQREAELRRVNSLFRAAGHRVTDITRLLQRRDSPLELRNTAAQVLGILRDRRTVPVLCRLLSDESDEAWWSIAASVEQMRDARAAPVLLGLMLHASSHELRGRSASILRSLPRSAEIVNGLIEVLQDQQEHPYVRGNAAESLGIRDNQDAFEALILGLQDASPEVRFWSAFALSSVANPQALAALGAVAAQDTAVVPGWWSVADECRLAINRIRLAAGEDIPEMDEPSRIPSS
jgi:HEAT repeat protein